MKQLISVKMTELSSESEGWAVPWNSHDTGLSIRVVGNRWGENMVPRSLDILIRANCKGSLDKKL